MSLSCGVGFSPWLLAWRCGPVRLRVPTWLRNLLWCIFHTMLPHVKKIMLHSHSQALSVHFWPVIPRRLKVCWHEAVKTQALWQRLPHLPVDVREAEAFVAWAHFKNMACCPQQGHKGDCSSGRSRCNRFCVFNAPHRTHFKMYLSKPRNCLSSSSVAGLSRPWSVPRKPCRR